MSEERSLGKLYNNGEIIVEEGALSRTLYVIQSGKVKVVKSTREGETVLAVLNEGDIFGEMSLFDASPRSATVKAVGNARILAIEHEGLLKRIRMDPSLAFRIIRQMSQRIRTLNSKLFITQKTIKQAGDNLLEISKTKDVYMKDIDDKLVFIRDNVKMIDKEFNKLNNVLIHMDVMPQ